MLKKPNGIEDISMVIEPKMKNLIAVSSQKARHFWIGDSSPLRLPLREPQYLIMNIFAKIAGLINCLHDVDLEFTSKIRNTDLNSDYQVLVDFDQ